ncbi:MAG: pantetheine-phosphate adenylyltransferase [Defluviitaleaceae bacterium]|nr:pantetheine-phosphate adenylyltransferase [Defluviitaleaceae bacterium]
MTTVYPGSFDPVTLGHTDIARRATKFADRVIVAVLKNPDKQTLFSVDERVALLKEAFAEDGKIEVESFDGLLADFVKQKNADAILRGLRSPEDFGRENKYAAANAALSSVDTIFLSATPALAFVSSSIVCEAAAHIYINDSDDSFVAQLVPPGVRAALRARFATKNANQGVVLNS